MRDWSLWDDEVAISTMDLCQTALGIHPDAFYSGVVFVKESDGESRRRASTIAGEVAIALKEELRHLVSANSTVSPALPSRSWSVVTTMPIRRSLPSVRSSRPLCSVGRLLWKSM